MDYDNFIKRKREILSKEDKSFKKSWDKKIIRLCDKINSLGNYYTTSSCSGRVVLMIGQNKKENGLFIKVYHDLINFEKLKRDLNKTLGQNKKNVKFKQEPCILHVACRTLKDAFNILGKARLAGWKRSGIISSGKRFIVELISTEKLEFPIISDNNLLVDDRFLKLIVRISNQNLKKSWAKIEKLCKALS